MHRRRVILISLETLTSEEIIVATFGAFFDAIKVFLLVASSFSEPFTSTCAVFLQFSWDTFVLTFFKVDVVWLNFRRFFCQFWGCPRLATGGPLTPRRLIARGSTRCDVRSFSGTPVRASSSSLRSCIGSTDKRIDTSSTKAFLPGPFKGTLALISFVPTSLFVRLLALTWTQSIFRRVGRRTDLTSGANPSSSVLCVSSLRTSIRPPHRRLAYLAVFFMHFRFLFCRQFLFSGPHRGHQLLFLLRASCHGASFRVVERQLPRPLDQQPQAGHHLKMGK